MDIKLNGNRALIATRAALYVAHKKKLKTSNKRVLIVFQQIFGDGVVIQNSLSSYTDLYPKSEGYEITFIVRPSVLAFMKDTLALPREINFESVNFKKFLEDYRYYKGVIRKYKNYASILIVPGTSLSAEIFSASVNADRKIGLVRSFPVTKPFINSYFYKRAYTETVVPGKEDMMLLRHRKMLNYLGLSTYRAKLPSLLPKDKIIKGNYAVCCPGSSKMEKCWPTDRFVTVINYVNDKYKLPVHLCGGSDEIEFAEEIISVVERPDMVISHIGKTTFSDWSAIVQHADLVIGNDSATMHLAAASRRKAICIAGVYDKYQFFPYMVDELNEDDRLPITILKDMPCEWCRTRGYDAGYGNKKCKNRIDQNLCSICIYYITVKEVVEAIDNLMEEQI